MLYVHNPINEYAFVAALVSSGSSFFAHQVVRLIGYLV
jgi:hypothetical protein